MDPREHLLSHPEDLDLVDHLRQRLLFHPGSFYRACVLGDDRFVNYGRAEDHMLTLLNLQVQNTRATAQRKAKYEDVIERPQVQLRKKRTVITAASVEQGAAVLFG